MKKKKLEEKVSQLNQTKFSIYIRNQTKLKYIIIII